MLGIVIVTHGKLSDGLKDSAEVIMGMVNNVATINLNQGEDIQELGTKIRQGIEAVDKGKGIIILVDLIGASPYNQSLLVASELNQELQEAVYVISGANLPILLETINHQILGTPVEQAAQAIATQGENSVERWHISMMTKEENEEDDF